MKLPGIFSKQLTFIRSILILVLVVCLLILLVDTSTAKSQNLVWTEGSPIPTPRSEASAALLDNRIYVIGGGDVRNSQYVILKDLDLGMTDSVEVYDPIADTWEKAPPLPEPLDHTVAAAYAGKLYVVGGFNMERDPTNKMYVYDPSVKEWKEGKSMPTARGAAEGAFISGVLYVVGGMKNHEGDEDEGPLSINEAYDPETDRWIEKAPMPTHRHHHQAVAVDGKLYVMGGRMTGLYTNLNNNEIYDPMTDSWVIGKSIPIRVSGFGATAENGTIYLFGGEGPLPRPFKDVMKYDILSNTWNLPNPSDPDLQLPTPRMGLAITKVEDRVYLIGGKVGPFEPGTGFNEIFSLDNVNK